MVSMGISSEAAMVAHVWRLQYAVMSENVRRSALSPAYARSLAMVLVYSFLVFVASFSSVMC